ncbi:MAG: GAF domain-containing protein [Anaerolineae bacterium]|nr:GAF domain-containing protein [Anaerolineae bacterium]
MFNSMKNFFALPTFADEEQNRNAYLLNFITIAYFVVAMITVGASFAASTDYGNTLKQASTQIVPLFIALIIAQVLMRAKLIRAATLSFGILLWLSQTYNVYISGGTSSYSLFNYVLSVMVFGLLLGRRYAIITAVVSVFTAFVFLVLDNNGLLPQSVNAAGGTETIGLFTFIFTAFLSTALLTQYLRQLDESFLKLRSANQALAESGSLLEQRVADRTRALSTSAEVSRRISTILNLQQLVTEVVEQVKSSFNYYHAHIYLMDESGRDLIMMGGTGDAGKIMLARGHKIPVGKGLVGLAAESGSLIRVSDTTEDPDWLPNPLLPDTKSEIAVPITLGEKVLGVLDVQQNVKDGLREEDGSLLQSIAFQVAVAVRNAQIYSETQQQAERESLINEIGRKIQNTASVEQALQVATRELGQALGARDARTIIDLQEIALNKAN